MMEPPKEETLSTGKDCCFLEMRIENAEQGLVNPSLYSVMNRSSRPAQRNRKPPVTAEDHPSPEKRNNAAMRDRGSGRRASQ